MALYRLNLTPDDNDTFLVTSPTFPEVTTFGATHEEAMRNGVQALEEAFAARISAGHDVPFCAATNAHDGLVVFVPVRSQVELKLDLYRALRRSGVSRAELTRRLDWNRNSVDRLFDLNHQSRLDQLDAAALALGLRYEATLVEADDAGLFDRMLCARQRLGDLVASNAIWSLNASDYCTLALGGGWLSAAVKVEPVFMGLRVECAPRERSSLIVCKREDEPQQKILL